MKYQIIILLFISTLLVSCNKDIVEVPQHPADCECEICVSDTGKGDTGKVIIPTPDPSVLGKCSYRTIDNISIPTNEGSSIDDLTYRIPYTNISTPLKTVIIQPGFFARTSRMDDLQNMLASHGYLVIGVNNDSHFNLITTELTPYKVSFEETIKHILDENSRDTSLLFTLIDTNAIALCGHSMGGGGVFLTMNDTLSLSSKVIKTAVAMNPFGTNRGENIEVPFMAFACENDEVFNPFMPGHTSKPESVYSCFETIRFSTEKLFMNYADLDHNAVCDFNLFLPTSGKTDLFYASIVSWFKVHLSDDLRYRDYLESDSEKFKTISDRFIAKGEVPAYSLE